MINVHWCAEIQATNHCYKDLLKLSVQRNKMELEQQQDSPGPRAFHIYDKVSSEATDSIDTSCNRGRDMQTTYRRVSSSVSGSLSSSFMAGMISDIYLLAGANTEGRGTCQPQNDRYSVSNHGQRT